MAARNKGINHSLVGVQLQHIVWPAHLIDARDVHASGAEALLDGHRVLERVGDVVAAVDELDGDADLGTR